jgi:hypothetical protein
MQKRKSSISIIFHSIISFLIWIMLLIIANILVSYINEPIYEMVIQFFNSLLVLFFIIFLIGMINSLFWNFSFPINLFAPILSAILSIFIVNLIYQIIKFIQIFVYFNGLANIDGLIQYPIYLLVFFTTLILGYLLIILEESHIEKEHSKDKTRENKRDLKNKRKSNGINVSGEDVKKEFRKVAYNIGEAINKGIKKDKKKKKR